MRERQEGKLADGGSERERERDQGGSSQLSFQEKSKGECHAPPRFLFCKESSCETEVVASHQTLPRAGTKRVNPREELNEKVISHSPEKNP